MVLANVGLQQLNRKLISKSNNNIAKSLHGVSGGWRVEGGNSSTIVSMSHPCPSEKQLITVLCAFWVRVH